MKHARTGPIALALSLLVGISAPTFASADLDAQAVRRARDHFERGLALYQDGKLDAAATEFRQAYELSPNAQVLFNLAQLRAAQGDHAAALRLYEGFLAGSGEQASSHVREHAKRQIAVLQELVARLLVSTSLPDAQLVVDGTAAANLPMAEPLVVNPGNHKVEIRAAGVPWVTERVTLKAGITVRLDLPTSANRRAALPTRRPPPAPAAPEASSGPGAGLWISLVSTVALASGAVTFAVLAHNAEDALQEELRLIPADRARVSEARTNLSRNSLVADSLTIGAVIAAGVSLYLALAQADDNADLERATARRRLRVLAQGGRLELRGAF